jgi:uncharacterized protein YfaP (DUF2135 family)
LSRATVNGSSVTLNWTYSGPPITGFEIVAFTDSGEEYRIQKPATAFTHTQLGVPNGNFVASIRALGVGTASALSDAILVVVGVALGEGALQVTLTWDSRADVDLHVVEPNGTHVFYGNRQGTTATLDRDDTDGFGPENIHVPGRPLDGNYRIYIVHFGNSVPTFCRIQVTVNAGTDNERSMVFNRQSSTANSSRSIEVALADPAAGTIQARNLLGEAFQEGESRDEVKTP